MEYKLENLEEMVRLPATDDFIKGIVREYFEIDSRSFNSTAELSDLIYKQLRVDPKSKGHVNHGDRISLGEEIKKDALASNPNATNPLLEQLGFFTFKSWHILGTERIHDADMRHRLYINIKADNLFALTKAIYDELKARKIPFYFKIQGAYNGKFFAEEGYKDSFVLYTSTPLLDATIKTILEVGKKHPELIQNCNEPSELVGKINNWLGYASETKEVGHSYTDNVCRAMASAIEQSVQSWCAKNGDVRIAGTTIDQYMANCVWNEYRTKTQALTSNIPKIDKTFVSGVCALAREEFEHVGLNPDNLCMTDAARDELHAYLSERRMGRGSISKSDQPGFDQRSPQEMVLASEIKAKNKVLKEQKERERTMSKVRVRVRVKNSDNKGFVNALIVTIGTVIVGVVLALVAAYLLK